MTKWLIYQGEECSEFTIENQYRVHDDESYVLLLDDDYGRQHCISWNRETKEILDDEWRWAEQPLPEYVRLNHSCLRLRGSGYYRDAGAWGVFYRMENNKILSVSTHGHLDNIELVPITKEEWALDDAGYIPTNKPKLTVEEATHVLCKNDNDNVFITTGVEYKIIRYDLSNVCILDDDDDLDNLYNIDLTKDGYLDDNSFEFINENNEEGLRSPQMKKTVIEDSEKPQNNLTNQPKEYIMNITKPTLIDGVDAATLSDADLLRKISDEESSIEKLKSIKADSVKVSKMIKANEKNIKKLVQILDARE